jgi:hypothetical protein
VGKPVQITGTGGDQCPIIMHTFLLFSVVSLFVDGTNWSFNTSPNHCATKSHQSFRFSVHVFLPARPTTCRTKFVESPKTITSCSATWEPAHLLRESRYKCDKTPAVVKQVVFLSAFAKSRKAAISFVMSVCPSPRMNNSVSIGGIFIKFYIWIFFENVSRKFKFH